MENSPFSFDFSKLEDQKRFSHLPESLKEAIITNAHETANQMQELVATKKARDYTDALTKVKQVRFGIYKGAIIVDPSGDVYLDLGGGRSLMGNAYEGAVTIVGADQITVDLEIVNKNLAVIFADIDQLINGPSGNA